MDAAICRLFLEHPTLREIRTTLLVDGSSHGQSVSPSVGPPLRALDLGQTAIAALHNSCSSELFVRLLRGPAASSDDRSLPKRFHP